MGWGADEIVEQIPTITLSDVHAPLITILTNRRNSLRKDQEEQFVDEFMRNNPSALEAKAETT